MSLFYENEWTHKNIKPFDSFAISLSRRVYVICARRSISYESSHTFHWQYMDLGIVFEWVNRGDAGLQGYFLAARALLWIYSLVEKSFITHTLLWLEVPKKTSHNPPSHTRKVMKSLAEIQHRHKWSKSHAALADSYKTQIIIQRCQKQSDRLHFVSQHNQFFSLLFLFCRIVSRFFCFGKHQSN